MTRNLATVLALSALAQVAAFGKSILIAYYFGIGADLDGYYLAQAIPAVLAGVLAGFLQTGLLTVYTRHIAGHEYETAAALLGRMLTVLAGLGATLAAVISLSAPWLVSLIAPEATAAAREAAVVSLRILAFLLILNALVDCLSLALNVHGSFAVAALAPTVNALVASALLLAMPDWGLGNLIWGTLIGLGAQLVVVAIECRRKKIRLSWGVNVDLRSTFMVGATIIPGMAFANLSGLVPQIVSATLGDGAVATFSIATRLHGAITQVLAIALSTALLPHFAHLVARSDYTSIAAQLRKGFPLVALLAVGALVWVGLVGESFVALAFERGAFTRSATASVASTWLWLTVGLLPMIWGTVLAKVLQAMQRGATLSAIAGFGLALTILACLLLSQVGGLKGLALAVAVGMLGTTVGSTIAVAGRLRISPIFPTWASRTGFAWIVFAIGSAAVTFAVDSSLRNSSRLYELVGVTICIGTLSAIGIRRLRKGKRN